MSFFDFFRSFQPVSNPIGFGAADFLEWFLALLLVPAALVWWPWLEPYVLRLARKRGWCLLLLAALPVVLRLCLLPHHPAPAPNLHEEFSHLLAADTLRHFRLANPAHPLHQFFETIYVLQEPAYSSIYAVGQGLLLALGRTLFGHPWAGVLLAAAAFCAFSYWMLRGWTTPGWALAGGLLAVIQFGPLCEWTNEYWGGALSAAAGCLIFGALPRLSRGFNRRDAALLGAGLGIHLLTRPFESILIAAAVGVFLAPVLRQPTQRRAFARAVPAMLLAMAPAIGLTLMQNRQATGSWMTPPYLLSRYEYGVPTTFTTQPNPVPHRELNPQQQLVYQMQASFHGARPESLRRYLERLEYRVRFYRFFFLPPLYVAIAAAFWRLRQFPVAWIFLTLLLLALGVNFYPLFSPQFLAGGTSLFLLLAVTGLEQLSGWQIRGYPVGWEAARLILFLCAAQFLFWYGLHLFDDRPFSIALRQYETWNGIDRAGDRRGAVQAQLAHMAGRHLVFVRYWPQHMFQEEWIYNAAEIDGSKVIWARDLGAAEDEKLRAYYKDRTVWMLEADAQPPRLEAYQVEPPSAPKLNVNPFEEIPQAPQ